TRLELLTPAPDQIPAHEVRDVRDGLLVPLDDKHVPRNAERAKLRRRHLDEAGRPALGRSGPLAAPPGASLLDDAHDEARRHVADFKLDAHRLNPRPPAG